MRKLIVLLATAGLLLGFTGSAQAGEFDPPNSTLSLLLGGLPAITISALTGTQSVVTLGPGSQGNPTLGHNIAIAGTAWSTVNFGPGTSLFTGVFCSKVSIRRGSGSSSCIAGDEFVAVAKDAINSRANGTSTALGAVRLCFLGLAAIVVPIPPTDIELKATRGRK